MKTRKKALIAVALVVLVLPIVFWVSSIVYANVLTVCLGDGLAPEAVDHWALSYGVDLEYKVLSYKPNQATVYYYCDDMGEKVKLIKENGKWRMAQSLSTWSDLGGSADDYFAWPYFKNYVL